MACVLHNLNTTMRYFRLKQLMFSFIFSLFAVGCFNSDEPVKRERLKNLTVEAKKLRAIIGVDSIRQEKISRVLAIIDRYNADMADTSKADIADQIVAMTLKHRNLDIDLLCATITHESSRWNPKSISRAGALGLMQIMPSTGKWLARSAGIEWTTPRKVLFDPILNIRLGSRYLSRLISAYDLEAGLAAYNGGLRVTEKWMARNKQDDILPDETEKYVPFVLNLYDKFKF